MVEELRKESTPGFLIFISLGPFLSALGVWKLRAERLK